MFNLVRASVQRCRTFRAVRARVLAPLQLRGRQLGGLCRDRCAHARAPDAGADERTGALPAGRDRRRGAVRAAQRIAEVLENRHWAR